MGSSGAETTPSKSEKESSPATQQEQTSMPAYPNWAAMQAYYPPGMTMPPPPYYNPAVGTGHPPHPFMWGAPQGMMAPYGSPYGAMYAHGGVYAHPSIPPGAHSQGPAVSASHVAGEAMVATPLSASTPPLSASTPAKSSSNKEHGLMKKLKGFDGLVVSLGNGDVNGGSGDMSQSGDYKTDGSSDGSDGNTATQQPRRKRSCEDMTSTGAEVSKLEGLPSDLWVKSERELKRERRKQSNRESARRSRLRKQAETEELATKVEALNVENMSLKSEISRLAEKSEKLRLENAAIMEKLKNAQSSNMETEEAQTIGTENFLAKVNNNSDSVTRPSQQESDFHENSNSGTKLHQLLESSPRTDAVAAG